MKIQSNSILSAAGSALLVTLCTTAVIGISLQAFLDLTSNQNRAVTRSQVYNNCLPVTEAGLEEGLTHLYLNYTNLNSDGWYSNNLTYTRSNTITGGRYIVIISNVTAQPVLYAYGYVPKPLGQPGDEILRLVRAETYGGAMFGKGMVAKGDINWNGTSESDSYDSLDPNYNTGGLYDPAKKKDNGSVASVEGNVDLGSGGKIYGSVGSGPFGEIENGKVGDDPWITNTTTSGYQPGHASSDFSMSFPEVTAPSTTGYNSPITPSYDAYFTNFVVSSNLISTNVLPSPIPAGGYSTNMVVVTNLTPPATGFFVGSITTNVSTNTTLYWPGAGYAVTTNIASSMLEWPQLYPTNGTYIGTVVTNTDPVANIRSNITAPPPDGYFVSGTYAYNSSNGKWGATLYTFTISNIVSYTYKATNYIFTNANNYTYWEPVTNQTITSTNYTHALISGNYTALEIGQNQRWYVEGDCTLVLDLGIDMNANSSVTIGPNGSLKIYSKGNITISGKGMANLSNDSLALSIYGTPTCTSISMGGNAAFCGYIYAPNAEFTANGGGNDATDCMGAIIVKKATLNGHFNFHYDENLGRNGPRAAFVIAGWNEL
jgi:hypothetical protein